MAVQIFRDQIGRLALMRRLSTAAFCQAVTAFFAVLPLASEVVTKKLAVCYPNIIVLVDPHCVTLTGYIDCMFAHQTSLKQTIQRFSLAASRRDDLPAFTSCVKVQSCELLPTICGLGPR
jgi:hypothetical protein